MENSALASNEIAIEEKEPIKVKKPIKPSYVVARVLWNLFQQLSMILAFISSLFPVITIIGFALVVLITNIVASNGPGENADLSAGISFMLNIVITLIISFVVAAIILAIGLIIDLIALHFAFVGFTISVSTRPYKWKWIPVLTFGATTIPAILTFILYLVIIVIFIIVAIFNTI